MKRKLIGIGIALVAISSCLALAQDRDHDRDHRHHATHHRVYVTTRTQYRHVPGGHQTITYYKYHRQRTGSRRDMTWYQRDPARPWYHPKSQYTKSEWDARVRAAQRRRHRHTSWADAVIRNGRRRRHHHHVIFTERRHDNGRHRGWYIGRGNPHRIGSKHHGRDHDRDHDKDRGGDKDKGHG